MNDYSFPEIDEFLKNVASKVSFQEAHGEIRQELLSHIQEAVTDGAAYGVSEQEAVRAVLKRMGSSDEIGEQLNLIHTPRLNWPQILMVMAFLFIGMFTMNSLGRLLPSLAFAGVGLSLGAILTMIPPKKIRNASLWLYAIPFGLYVLALSFGSRYDGQPYLELGVLHVKIVDFAVLPIVLSLAGLFSKSPANSGSKAWLPMGLTILPIACFSAVGSLFPSLVLLAACLSIMFATSAKKWQIYFTAVVSTLILLFFAGKETFVSAKGLGNLRSLETHTDFVFSNLQANAPVFAALALILSLLLTVQIAMLGREVKSTYGKAVAMGCLAVFVSEFMWSILSNVGYAPMPVTGINFPFLSYGGSLMIGHMALMGVLLGIYRRKQLALI